MLATSWMMEEMDQSDGSSALDRASKHIFESPSTMMLHQFSAVAKFRAHIIATASAWVGVHKSWIFAHTFNTSPNSFLATTTKEVKAYETAASTFSFIQFLGGGIHEVNSTLLSLSCSWSKAIRYSFTLFSALHMVEMMFTSLPLCLTWFLRCQIASIVTAI